MVCPSATAPGFFTFGSTARRDRRVAGVCVCRGSSAQAPPGRREPERYTSVSAFSPICNPSAVPWGKKALGGYLGGDTEKWAEHDASALLAAGRGRGAFDDILVDQGLDDQFLSGEVDQLRPDALEAAAASAGQKLTLRRHEGFDHSYFFVTSFIEEHVAFHADRMAAKTSELAARAAEAAAIAPASADPAGTVGEVITCKAAVAWAPKQPVKTETVLVAPPKEGRPARSRS